MTQCTHNTPENGNTWPACPWCRSDLAVFDRDPITQSIRYTCLRGTCPCHGQAMIPELDA